MQWEYLLFGSSGIILIVLITILISLIVKHKNRVNVQMNTIYGDVAAYGNKKDYMIEVDQRYLFVVHNGEIISYQDKENSNQMTDYAGGEISC